MIQSISLSHTNSAKKKIDYRAKMQSAMEDEKRRNQAMIDEYSKRFKSTNETRAMSPSRSNNRLPSIQMDRNSSSFGHPKKHFERRSVSMIGMGTGKNSYRQNDKLTIVTY